MHDIENEVEAKDDDFDFELEITDLPPDRKIDHLLARLRALRAQLTSEMRSQLLFKQSSSANQDKAADDDFELEITDLPESERPELPGIAAPVANWASRFSPRIRGKPTWTRNPINLAPTAVIAGILIVLVIWGGIPSACNKALSLLAQPTPTPATTSGSSDVTGQHVITGSGRIIGSSNAQIFVWGSENGTQVISVQDNLGPVPQDCPQNTPQGPDSPPFPSFVGGTPLWITGFDGSSTALTHLKHAKQLELGWYQQITLLLQSNHVGDVMLQGGDMNDNAPLSFDTIPPNQGLTTLLMLRSTDPSLSNHTVGDQSWISLTTNVYVPASGCYYLSAEWAGGSWTIYFAAGK
jgi:hypothetical protein